MRPANFVKEVTKMSKLWTVALTGAVTVAGGMAQSHAVEEITTGSKANGQLVAENRADNNEGRGMADRKRDKRAKEAESHLVRSENFPLIEIQRGFEIQKVAEGLTFPTALTFDDEGRMYVAEAGGGFLEEPPAPRILRIEDGQASEVVNLEGLVEASVVGLVFHDGAFFITHRDPATRTGAVSRVTPEGGFTQILSGIIDSQAEHQVNDIKVGPDGQMYVATGPATNSGVVGLDLAPFIALSPDLKPTPCQDIVLTGINFKTPDFRTKEDESDFVMTGAYVPFGTPTEPGQVIPGTNKCGGSVLVFDPDQAEETVRPFAHGLRNVIGLAFNEEGELFAAINGYDNRGSRPFDDEHDVVYRIREGAWYGWPDYSADFRPATNPIFDTPNALQAAKFKAGEPLPLDSLDFLIDHEASGLERPDQSLIASLHEINSSPSGLDVAPESWGRRFADHLFIAEWGDLAPPTNPLLDKKPGYQITQYHPGDGPKMPKPFVQNVEPGPASELGKLGEGIERPYYVKFGPDGAMYIVDFGQAFANRPDAGPGDDPYNFAPETGIIWRVAPVQEQ
jgi:glucose/arabinose dehydrogenase